MTRYDSDNGQDDNNSHNLFLDDNPYEEVETFYNLHEIKDTKRTHEFKVENLAGKNHQRRRR